MMLGACVMHGWLRGKFVFVHAIIAYGSVEVYLRSFLMFTLDYFQSPSSLTPTPSFKKLLQAIGFRKGAGMFDQSSESYLFKDNSLLN
jgi:hypothetical protein